MMSFKQYLEEGIEDKGIFKAMFVVGMPGAGKSYTVERISSGSISPRIVNTDDATEFLAKKYGVRSSIENWKSFFSDKSKRITSKMLSNYLNGMLPLFIDGTSNNTGAVLGRAGLLESLGYDVGMVFVNTDLETALKRAAGRSDTVPRDVSPEFIAGVNERVKESRDYFAGKFSFFREVDNNDGQLDNDVITTLYKEVSEFFTQSIENPVGKKTFMELRESKQKYLVPSIMEMEVLERKVAGWYARA